MAVILSNLLIGLLYITEGISFAKDPLSSSFEELTQCHSPVRLSVQLTIKTKHMFEPPTRYCHIHLACTSVRYERKMHVLIIQK